MSFVSLTIAALLAPAGRPAAAPVHFNFSVDWAAGGPATTLPMANFSVRKLEAFVCESRWLPPDPHVSDRVWNGMPSSSVHTALHLST